MAEIRIEQVGDITVKFSYLEVFVQGATEPFMEVGITKDEQLEFLLYKYPSPVSLSVQQWQRILDVAKDFLPSELENSKFQPEG